MFGFKKKKSHSDEKPEKPEKLAVDEAVEAIDQPDIEQAPTNVSAAEPPQTDESVETALHNDTPADIEQIPAAPKKPKRNLFGFLKKQQPEPEAAPLTKIPPVEPQPQPQPPSTKYKYAAENTAVDETLPASVEPKDLQVGEATQEIDQPTAEELIQAQVVETPQAESAVEEAEELTDPTMEIPEIEIPAEPQAVEIEVEVDPAPDESEEPLLPPTEHDISQPVDLEAEDTPEETSAETFSENEDATSEETTPAEAALSETEQEEAKQGFFKRLRSGLSKTGSNITGGMGDLVLGKREIDDELFEELETRLLMADVGIETTTQIIDSLNKRVKRKNMTDADALYGALADAMQETLEPCSIPLIIDQTQQPFVILVIGVNGAGKTTTIGKLAKNFQDGGFSVMLAAGDTFRAAAVEQLTIWGERNDVPVISQGTGADSASVVFDALQAAKARNIDILIADTAGRLHTQDNLMEELKKVKRVLGKIDGGAPHETLLVLDGGTGQNALKQGESFHEEIGVTGLAITKLDGTAKGGVLFAMANKLGLPIRYIGVGEGIEDLRVFNAEDFVHALVSPDDDAPQ